MKKTFLSIFAMLVIVSANCQEVRNTLGVGLQSSFPIFGLSVKYGITERSMVQATIAPFGVKTDGGGISMNFYGARYIQRFPANEDASVKIDPYLFAGGGLINYKTNFKSIGLANTSDKFFGYSAGGGLEIMVINNLCLSAEIGYGKLSISSGTGVRTILFGTGIHYYIK